MMTILYEEMTCSCTHKHTPVTTVLLC